MSYVMRDAMHAIIYDAMSYVMRDAMYAMSYVIRDIWDHI